MEIQDSLVNEDDKIFRNVLDSLAFDLIGRNLYAEAKPSVVDFNFSQLNEKQKKALRITNITTVASRVTVIPPSTSAFEIFFRKKGTLAPGISEEIFVIFKPTEWVHYTDSIKVMTRGGSHLLIPIRGIPGTPVVNIPRYIDFGVVSINETATRKLTLENKVPIEYSFELKECSYSTEIVIDPKEGQVPGNGSTDITFTFSPLCFTTLSVPLELSFSNSAAIKKINVIGSCQPPTLIPQVLEEVPRSPVTVDVRPKPSPRVSSPKIRMQPEDSDALKEIFFEQSIFGPVKHACEMKPSRVTRCIGEQLPTESQLIEIENARKRQVEVVNAKIIEKAFNHRNGMLLSEDAVTAPKSVTPVFDGLPMRSTFRIRLRSIDTLTRVITAIMEKNRALKRLKILQMNGKLE